MDKFMEFIVGRSSLQRPYNYCGVRLVTERFLCTPGP